MKKQFHLVVIILIFLSLPSKTFANEIYTKLEFIIVEKNDNEIFRIPYTVYKDSFRYKDYYYKFLSKDRGFAKILGVEGNGKTAEYSSYKDLLRYKKSISISIEESDEISIKKTEIIKNIELIEFKLEQLKIGKNNAIINDNIIEINIFKDQLFSPIRNISFNFDTQVKLNKVNDNPLDSLIVDKLISSGYEINSYNNEYIINLSDKWIYSFILDGLNINEDMVINFENEYGLQKEYIVRFKLLD